MWFYESQVASAARASGDPPGRFLGAAGRMVFDAVHPKSVCVRLLAAGPLSVQEALTYVGGAVASTTGLVMGGTLLALLRRRCRQKGNLAGGCPSLPLS